MCALNHDDGLSTIVTSLNDDDGICRRESVVHGRQKNDDFAALMRRFVDRDDDVAGRHSTWCKNSCLFD